MFTVTMLWAIF